MKKINNKEIDEIKKAISVYFEGIKSLDPDKIYKVFHRDANMMTINPEGKLVISDSSVWERLCSNYKQNIKDLNDYKFSSSIENIDLVKNLAFVKVKMTIDIPTRISNFIDLYHMLKIENKWMIIAKSYHGDHQTKE